MDDALQITSTRLEERDKRLPDFIIIGAMKCGTTSLYQYLRQHPAISACAIKEPGFFCDINWHRGIDWYRSLYKANSKIKFEASTHYTKAPHLGPVAERISKIVPDVKLIYIIRHPIERLISHLHDAIVRKLMEADQVFSTDFITDSETGYVKYSQYYDQINCYLPYFDLSRILIVRLEDMIERPLQLMRQILDYVGIEKNIYDDKFLYFKYNKLGTFARVRLRKMYFLFSSANRKGLIPPIHRLMEERVPRPELTREQQQNLWNIFSEDINKLEALIGRNLGYKPPE